MMDAAVTLAEPWMLTASARVEFVPRTQLVAVTPLLPVASSCPVTPPGGPGTASRQAAPFGRSAATPRVSMIGSVPTNRLVTSRGRVRWMMTSTAVTLAVFAPREGGLLTVTEVRPPLVKPLRVATSARVSFAWTRASARLRPSADCAIRRRTAPA
jgi:hypothetical protein